MSISTNTNINLHRRQAYRLASLPHQPALQVD